MTELNCVIFRRVDGHVVHQLNLCIHLGVVDACLRVSPLSSKNLCVVTKYHLRPLSIQLGTYSTDSSDHGKEIQLHMTHPSLSYIRLTISVYIEANNGK